MNFMEEYKVNYYFTTQAEIVSELIMIMRVFADGEINQMDLEELMVIYVNHYAQFLFLLKNKKIAFKAFPKQKLGKKRIRTLATCLTNNGLVELFDAKNYEFMSRKLFKLLA